MSRRNEKSYLEKWTLTESFFGGSLIKNPDYPTPHTPKTNPKSECTYNDMFWTQNNRNYCFGGV